METWLMNMNYTPMSENMDELLSQLKSLSTPGTKKVWKHIVAHIRPKKEIEVIRQQCLLHKLNTSTPPYFNIEFKLNNLKDFDSYTQKKKDLSKLNKISQQVLEKKKVIEEKLNKLELSRQNSVLEEEVLKESVYKLNHLKKKRKTVEKAINKLESDTKTLKILRTVPNKFVHYGSKVSDWERKVLMYVSELPPGMEIEALVSKMGELLKSSALTAPPLWDRSEIITTMEKILPSKIQLLNDIKSESVEIDNKLQKSKNNIMELLKQENSNNHEELCEFLDDFIQNISKEVSDLGKEFVENDPPYILEAERHTCRRLSHLIEVKGKDLGKILIESKDYSSSDLHILSSETTLPRRPVTKMLMNSVSKEVKIFKDLIIRKNLPNYIIDHIQPCISSYSQFLELNNAMHIHSKLMVLEEKLRNLDLPVLDCLSSGNEVQNKVNQFNSDISERLKYIKSETEALEEIYERLKAGFNFLRKEPLNENLMGMKIEDKDISYWLKRYATSKKKYDHELWLLNNPMN